MEGKAAFDALVKKIGERCPAFRIRYKEDFWWEKALGLLLRLTGINPNYYTSYITTWGDSVHWPTKKMLEANWDSAFKVLAHEYIHLWRKKVTGGWYLVRWASPQCLTLLALLALLAIWNLWFLTALVFLLFVLPWASPGRTDEEMRGYTMNLAVNIWRYGEVLDGTIDWIVPQFTGRWYFWMCRDEAAVRKRLTSEIGNIQTGVLLKGEDGVPYQDVHDIIKG